MTYTQIHDAIINYCKIESVTASKVDVVVQAVIDRVYYEMTRMQLLQEFYVARESITLTNNSGTVQLSKKCNSLPGSIDRVSFASGSYEWDLVPQDTRVPPAPIYGKPRTYVLQAIPISSTGDALLVEPFATVANTDKVYVWYYRLPLSLGPTADDSHVTSTEFKDKDGELIDRCCIEVFNYYNKQTEAALLAAKYKSPPQTQG